MPTPLAPFTPEVLLTATVLAPGIAFLGMSILWLLSVTLREKTIGRVANATYAFCFVSFALLIGSMWAAGRNSVNAGSGDWYAVGEFRIPFGLQGDALSLPLIAMTIVLAGLISVFSRRYIHRDAGFHRFYILLHLFAFGSLLVFAASSMDLLVGGWELICVTSTLLVAFFHARPEPVKNSIRIFATYRACDVGLIAGAFFLHHWSGSTLYRAAFSGEWPQQHFAMSQSDATVIGVLLLIGAMGKSAQVPFSGWLPRAMEGPTPSSAIFYGAISVHAGAYLLLRVQPILQASPVASGAVIAVGILSAIHGTMVARTCTDAKTTLAYASVSQLGLIFVEIGAGFPRLALLHILGHAVVRTFQFLKAPTALHEFHGIHAAAGGHLARNGRHYEAVLPLGMQEWLYRHALDRGHLDAILDRFLTGTLRRLALRVRNVEERLVGTRLSRGEARFLG